ncbi:hypothetical protein C8J56DRAFT_890421 [Mycena floridula]|nr:hypothetical protein C8J56DRAFT_890421 [Mycena floridula]
MTTSLNFMHPLSIAFTSDTIASGFKRTASELNFVTSGKLTLVLSLIEARIVQFTFLLDMKDGGHYLLQAMNRKEIEKVNWVKKMATNNVTEEAAHMWHSHPNSLDFQTHLFFLSFLIEVKQEAIMNIIVISGLIGQNPSPAMDPHLSAAMGLLDLAGDSLYVPVDQGLSGETLTLDTAAASLAMLEISNDVPSEPQEQCYTVAGQQFVHRPVPGMVKMIPGIPFRWQVVGGPRDDEIACYVFGGCVMMLKSIQNLHPHIYEQVYALAKGLHLLAFGGFNSEGKLV